MVMRGAKRKGVRYFGPFAHAYAIRETLDLLLRTFPIRTCTDVEVPAPRTARPAVPLRAHREVRGAVRRRDRPRRRTRQLVAELISFLDGDTAPVLDRLEKQMHEASEALEFERAARVRDQLLSVRKVIERQQMVGAKEEDLDVIGIAEDPLEASVQVFYVRRGRVTGRKGLVVDKVEDVDPPELVARILEQLYGDAPAEDVPARGARPGRAGAARALRGVPSLTREKSKVRIRVPQRGEKRALLETVTRNAQEAFGRHKLSGRPTTTPAPGRWSRCRRRSSLPEAPLRIECFDISNLQGTDIVASMTVLEDGLPKRSDYRHFKIKRPGRSGRLRRDGRGADPPVQALPRGARPGRARRASGSPTRRTCW